MKNLRYLMCRSLETKLAFGVSKKQTKQELETNVSPYIHSEKTFKSYLASCKHFADYIKNNDEITDKPKTLEDAVKYAQGYIDTQESAWSQQHERAALSKALNIPGNELATCKTRHASDIHKSRGEDETGGDRQESLELRYPDLEKIGNSCGLRHSEYKYLEPKNIVEHENGDVDIVHVLGKGGRFRNVHVLEGPGKELLLSYAANPNEDGKLFDKSNLPEHFDCHKIRGQYACLCYDKALENGYGTGEMYVLRDGSDRQFDKGALDYVSKQLGHNENRFYTIVYNYLYNHK